MKKQRNSALPGMKFAWIPPGEFWMGSPEDEPGRWDDESPRHRVRLTRGYFMQTTPVTQAQWKAVMGENPSYFKNAGPNAPVENVSYYDVQEFIQKLNQREGSDRFRLPTEAEWEYACRAGTETAFYSELITELNGFDSNLDKVGWFDENSGETTHPVGQKEPNAWGLYDMHGNVWEWCQDWFGEYPYGPIDAPTGPESGAARVLRGGGWSYLARKCRAAYRLDYAPDFRDGILGFRIIMISSEVPEPEQTSFSKKGNEMIPRPPYQCPDCGEYTHYTPEDLPDECDNCGSWTPLRGQTVEPTYDPRSRHYDAGGIETLNVIRAKLTPDQYQGFLMGNLIKYILRANFKEDFARDIDKAARYAKWLDELQKGDRE